MANQLIRNEVIKEVFSALKAFADIGDMDHSGLKGPIREIIAEKLCSTGTIINFLFTTLVGYNY
jgi:hypothetical protein